MRKQVGQPDAAKTTSCLVLGLSLLAAVFVPSTLGQYYGYVTNPGEMGSHIKGSVSVIDLATNTVIATVPVGEYPQGVAINPAGTAVYVANSDSNDVTVIDTATFKTTTIPGGACPVGAAMHPDGTRIYAANVNDTKNTISVIDRATNTIIDSIFCGDGSIAAAVHPDGSVVYVANIMGGSIAVLDTRTHKVVDTIMLKPVGAEEPSFPVPLLVHPDGTFVYVANRLGPTVWMINTATYEVAAVASGHDHVGLGLNPAGTVLYVPDFNDSPQDWTLPPAGTAVDVLDAKTLKRITTIEGLHAPLDVSVHPDGTRVYITNWGSNTVTVHDATTYAVLATIPVGSHPHGFGEFIGPGVPHLLLEDAVARLQAVKATIAGGTEGVNSPEKAVEHLATALTSGNACLQENLWSAADGKVDPRRLLRAQGATLFASEQTMVQAMLDAIRLGWIVSAKLETELLAIVDEVVRADRVLAAVAIDDALVAKADAAGLDKAQKLLQEADTTAKEAAVWPQLDKKTTLFREAITGYRAAWDAAVKLVP